MSIHGNQYILPLFISEMNTPSIKENDELALAFYLLTKNLKPNEKIISFSRLLWPFLCIQGVISTHIILDGLTVFSKIGKLSNPPRQPLIGHLLRNIDNYTKTEELQKIIEVLTYKDQEAQEIGEGEESEFQEVNIKGLINPQFLQTMRKLLPLVDYQPISGYMPLEPSFTTEEALDITEKYRNTVEYMKGNSLRWETQIELIGKEVEKWLIDLNVQLKDISTRYSSQITKTSQSIDSDQVNRHLALEKDKIDQWNVNEKKRLVENISLLFKTVERQLEEILKRNKFYTQGEMLKGKVFEDLTSSFESHFKFLIDEGNKFINSVTTLTESYMEFKEKAPQIDAEAEKRLSDIRVSLESQLKDRDKNLSEFENEKEQKIREIEDLRIKIESMYENIASIIKSKSNTCIHESRELTSWALTDDQSELFSRPIQWIYMPLYAMFVEDQSSMDEKMYAIYPGIVSNDSTKLFNDISDEIVSLKNTVNEKLENDMSLRSNFEFSCENRNLLDDRSLDKKIQQGISILRNYGIIDSEIEQKIREKLNLALQV